VIRLGLPSSAANWLAIVYSPVIETIFSLHVLTKPRHHPLQHEWVRSSSRLPAELRRRIAEFAWAYDGYMPTLASPSGQYSSFDEELESLRALEEDQLRVELLRPFALEFPRSPEMLDQPGIRDLILSRAAASESSADRAVRLALEDPRAVLGQLIEVLVEYWERAFEQEWGRLEPLLADTVTAAGRAFAAAGPYAFLSQVNPRLRADRGQGCLWIDKNPDAEEGLLEGGHLVLVPSAYIWPHLGVELDEMLPSIVYPAPFMTVEARPRIPPQELLRVLRSLGDDTRLRALRLIAERPRSTQELAQLVRVSESALSKHLRLMAEAGILTTRRHGHYVLYQIVPGRLDAVSSSIAAYLASDPGSPPG
jgi:DNA-binding transcriptional ArsR family regulator